MIVGKPGYRVGLAGANSLLGQEILRVLKERNFPVARLMKFEVEPEEADLPVIDLSGESEFEVSAESAEHGLLDALFLAARLGAKNAESPALDKALESAGFDRTASDAAHLIVVDSTQALSSSLPKTLSIPSIEKLRRDAPNQLATLFASPHPATIVLSRILLNLSDRFKIRHSVAQVFLPVSEFGPRGIAELQKQTVSLLSFQKFPEKIFGTQLAFNLLPRLHGKHATEIAASESDIRRELREYTSGRIPLSAVHFCHPAVFYSLAFSIFVEFEANPGAAEVSAALSGEGMKVRRQNEIPPHQVEAAGSGDILIDAITGDPDCPGGYWIWAAVDNIRLAAENSVDIAERFLSARRLKQ